MPVNPILLLCTFLFLLHTHVRSTFTASILPIFPRRPPLAPQFTLGQTDVNRLRHAVAVSNLPSVFGKFGHILLSRNVEVPSRIWEHVDPFTREVLKDPNRLDWLVANVDARNTVTIHGGFSCLDLGSSSAVPGFWWASQTLGILTNKSNGPGGAVFKISGGEATTTDITAQCLQGRGDSPDLRLVEHIGLHKGEGVAFKSDYKRFVSFIDDPNIFEEFRRQRAAVDPSNEVIFEKETNIPIVVGITFDTGFRILVPPNFTTRQTLELRVPMTPLASITRHGGAHEYEMSASTSTPRTTRAILVLDLFTTGLAFMGAVWLLTMQVSNATRDRSAENLKKPTHLAIEGTGGWTFSQKASFILSLFLVIILFTPIALAFVEGKTDPRASVEVTTAATVLYGSSQPNLSADLQNPVAGAPFQVTVFMAVRKLDDGHFVALALSVGAILCLSVAIVLLNAHESSEVMPSQKRNLGGWSLLKRLGTARLQSKSRDRGKVRRYTVFVTVKPKAIADMGIIPDEFAREVLLLGNVDFRERANAHFGTKKERLSNASTVREASGAVHAEFARRGQFNYGILARVRMDDTERYKATMTRSGVWHDRLPREWEWLRRKFGCRSLEYYRTNGKEFPSDEPLVLVKMGLLPYMKYVDPDKVWIGNDNSQSTLRYDRDEVQSVVCVTEREAGFEGTIGIDARVSGQHAVDLDDDGNGLLHAASGQQLGSGCQLDEFVVQYAEGNIRVAYYNLLEESDGGE